MKSFALVLALFSSSQALASAACQDLFYTVQERLETVGIEYPALLRSVSLLNPYVLNGQMTPRWEDFNQLKTLLEAVRATKEKASSERLDLVSKILEDLPASIKPRTLLGNIASAQKLHTQTNKYEPTEYELKLMYQFMIGQLNRELPSHVRLPIARLPLDPRRKSMTQPVRELMSTMEKTTERLFESTGHKSYEEYEKFIRAHEDPHVRKAVEMIDKNQIEIIIRRPESGRFWIPKVGFQNQYVTGRSRGFFDKDLRQSAEARLVGLMETSEHASGLKQYRSLDSEVMPKYATLRPSPESGIVYSRTATEQYGADFYVLRLKNIDDRLTWTTGDSLLRGWDKRALQGWGDTFTPWKFRLLMVPFLVQAIAVKTLESARPDQLGTVKYNPSHLHPYWETQIFGPLTLKHVEKFEFTSQPPSGAFLRELLDAGIPIRDARQSPPVDWNPTLEDLATARAAVL